MLGSVVLGAVLVRDIDQGRALRVPPVVLLVAREPRYAGLEVSLRLRARHSDDLFGRVGGVGEKVECVLRHRLDAVALVEVEVFKDVWRAREDVCTAHRGDFYDNRVPRVDLFGRGIGVVVVRVVLIVREAVPHDGLFFGFAVRAGVIVSALQRHITLHIGLLCACALRRQEVAAKALVLDLKRGDCSAFLLRGIVVPKLDGAVAFVEPTTGALRDFLDDRLYLLALRIGELVFTRGRCLRRRRARELERACQKAEGRKSLDSCRH